MASHAEVPESERCPNQHWCHGNASSICLSLPRLCGTCCNCSGHSRRRRRAGKTKGRASKATRQSSVVGLRVPLLETLLDHIIGTDAVNMSLHGVTSRRMLRRSIIDLLAVEKDVHLVPLHER